MNLHEYQGKEILASFGVGIQRGPVAHTTDEAVEAAKQLTETTGTGWHVIKAQIHAGGRGKGEASSWQKPWWGKKHCRSNHRHAVDNRQHLQRVNPCTKYWLRKMYYPGESEPVNFMSRSCWTVPRAQYDHVFYWRGNGHWNSRRRNPPFNIHRRNRPCSGYPRFSSP